MKNSPMKKAATVFLLILIAAIAAALIGVAVNAVSNAMSGFTAIGVPRVIVPSPDNEWLASRMEFWKNDERVRTVSVENLHNGIFYSLTPEYLEIIQGPDPSVIAYISRDSTTNWYTVGVYAPDRQTVTYSLEKEALIKKPISHPYTVDSADTSLLKKDLAFSSDGQYLRFVKRRNFEPLGRSFYSYRTLDGKAHIDWTDDDFKHVTWLPPQKPAKLPDFMTEKTPHIHEETVPVWSPDSDALYVHDEEGIWRVNLLMPRMQVWKLFLPMEGVRAFCLSADGQRLLATIDGEDGDPSVVLVDLKSADRAPKRIGPGWGAAFSPDSSRFVFVDASGLYVGSVEKGAARRIETSERRNFGRNAAPIWTSDNAAVYVQADEGVWRVNADATENGAWELALPLEEVGSFDVSSDGRWLLAESGDGVNADRTFNSLRKGLQRKDIQRFVDRLGAESRKYERNLMLKDLHNAEAEPTHVGYGWMPMFNAGSEGMPMFGAAGDHYFFGTYFGIFANSPENALPVPHMLTIAIWNEL